MDHSNLPQNQVAREPVQRDMLSSKECREYYGMEDWAFFERKFREFDAAIPKDSRELRLAAQGATAEALEFYEGLAPTDSVERMLARQMVVSHMMAMFLMKRANLSVNSSESRDREIKHSQSFMNVFLKQQAALAKYRNKGQQRIVVEKVHVAQGGQAIVGNVAVTKQTGTGGSAPNSRDDKPLVGLV